MSNWRSESVKKIQSLVAAARPDVRVRRPPRLRWPAWKCRVRRFATLRGLLRLGAYPQALNEADHDGSYAFRRLGRTQEDDLGGDGGGDRGRRGALLRHDRQHAGRDPRLMQEADERRAAAAFLLRGRAVRIWRAASTEQAGTPLR